MFFGYDALVIKSQLILCKIILAKLQNNTTNTIIATEWNKSIRDRVELTPMLLTVFFLLFCMLNISTIDSKLSIIKDKHSGKFYWWNSLIGACEKMLWHDMF